jgi:hypothetical protein
VKRVWGASSGVVDIRVEEGGLDGDVDVEGKDGRVILKVSVRGLKDRVVLRVESGVTSWVSFSCLSVFGFSSSCVEAYLESG